MHLSGLRRRYDDNLSDDDRRGCVFAMAATALVCVSAFLSWRELVYLTRSRFVDATVLRIYETHGRGAGTVVDFEFTDPATGALRRHSHKLSLGWRQPPGPLRIEFVPGSDTYARVAGHTQRWSLWFFGGALLTAGIYLGRLIREANTPIQRKRRYNRDYLD